MIRNLLNILFVIILVAGCQIGEKQTPIVKKVEHILLKVDGVNTQQRLWNFFVDTLKLPTVWPLNDYGTFASGGVSAGNVVLEIYRNTDDFSNEGDAKLDGFAFEPYNGTESCIKELDNRQIYHSKPDSSMKKSEDGKKVTGWITFDINDVLTDETSIFVCDYKIDVRPGRMLASQDLRNIQGGPLSLERVKEILVGTTNVKSEKKRWQNLMAPYSYDENNGFLLAEGPAIRIVENSDDSLVELLFEVTSFSQARSFLEEHTLLDKESRNDMLLIQLPDIQGLRLVISGTSAL
ncbi:hypothetical protein ACFLZA_01280 [Candidatus Neomarinimicrobiota bacterium]